ncbi:unnamed protein product, partial [Owenia fusiformis]
FLLATSTARIELEREKQPLETVVKAVKAPEPTQVAPDEPPRFTSKLKPIIAKDGDRVTFQVNFVGKPSPEINWYYNRQKITTSSDFEVSIDVEQGSSSLVIIEVFPEDQGEYMCTASNKYGTTSTSCTLVVE